MKYPQLLRGLLVTILGAMALISTNSVLASPMLTFTPSTASFSAGDSVNVDVQVSNLGSNIVAAYDLDFLYDASTLNATGVSFANNLGEPLFFETLQSAVLTTPGLVDFAELSLLSDSDLASLQGLLGGTVPLATIAFNAVAAGTSGNSLAGFSFSAGNDVKCANNTVCIPSVPEPSPVFLLILGLAAMTVGGRRLAHPTKG